MPIARLVLSLHRTIPDNARQEEMTGGSVERRRRFFSFPMSAYSGHGFVRRASLGGGSGPCGAASSFPLVKSNVITTAPVHKPELPRPSSHAPPKPDPRSSPICSSPRPLAACRRKHWLLFFWAPASAMKASPARDARSDNGNLLTCVVACAQFPEGILRRLVSRTVTLTRSGGGWVAPPIRFSRMSCDLPVYAGAWSQGLVRSCPAGVCRRS